jgi:hypothetical protein
MAKIYLDTSIYNRPFDAQTHDRLLWDKQFEADVADGKLDFLLEEAIAEKSQGTLRDL